MISSLKFNSSVFILTDSSPKHYLLYFLSLLRFSQIFENEPYLITGKYFLTDFVT